MSNQAVKQQENLSETTKGLKENEGIVQKIADKLGVAAKSIKVYGKPIESEGITIVPVSKVSYGFGGGAGKQNEQEGSGGGGGLHTSPIGYIEIKNGEAKFRQIMDMNLLAPLMLSGSLGLLTVFWGIGKILRNSKKEK